ncbi:FKBP-type peptidyl-prolyl cis-trans isomerase [Cupriavidus basilensis]|jgi:FKBP-type peptidyl-prolyl cis-trans isomerase SlpA|uniref:FKBP-type peptidyl-prolyl cis-trans isomerase n=1 Tax=Cupriavidus TaxID=106589 RepID=UPI0004461A58|nr:MULTISPECIES: peptidylprolyl isomerase [Cupriavidus]KDP86130.1 peptidylprolyl isomerase [Cupriavidus sp. SK-3]KJK24125.1 peptidylprolyl isomerase [Burkholderiaceae bacterium 16]MDF3883603.1 peptidylprolyl isomerase [Cupriavidus basilensis]
MNLQTIASGPKDGAADGRKTVQADSFLTLHYSISLENGTEIISTFEEKPATLLLGQGQFAPTLEQALLGMPEGERMTYRLAAEHAFGPRNPELLQRVSLATLRENSSFEEDYAPGDLVEFNAPGGGKYAGVLKEIGATSALFDFNHPLAGQTILFDVQLIGIL